MAFGNSSASTELTRLLECRICLDGLKNCHICCYCSQPFCRTCADDWFEKDRKCPCCRTNLACPRWLVKVGTFDELQEQLNKLMIDETRNRCGQHPKDRLSLFCAPCKKCICVSCLLSEQHRDHKDQAVLLDEIYAQYEDNLRSVLTRIENRKASIVASLDDIDDNLKNITKQMKDQMQILEANMSSFEKLQNRAEALLTAKKDASSLQTILDVLESAGSFLSEEVQVSTEIDQRLLKYSLLKPVTFEFRLDLNATGDDNGDLFAEPQSMDGFSWVVKFDAGNAVYLSMHEGIPGEYSVALGDEPAKPIRFELSKFALLGEVVLLGADSELNTYVAVVHVQQARTFQERCAQQERYIKQLEARIAEGKIY
uniref:Putative e3 ubiquitin-protein ligase trim37 n=1 Tax=Culex tarsalis TaxID=7177 RepID=A0A1Q3EVY6_CULTA